MPTASAAWPRELCWLAPSSRTTYVLVRCRHFRPDVGVRSTTEIIRSFGQGEQYSVGRFSASGKLP